jgi:Transcriptional regulator, AbiEi antitoxin
MPKKIDPFAALVKTAQDQQGYFTTKQAIQAGYADNTHPYHVRAGNWERVRRGIYQMAHLPPPEDGEMMAWLLWSRGRDQEPAAVMSHQTALSLFELGDFNPAKIHLIVPPTFRRNTRPPQTVVLHRSGVAPADLTHLRGLTVCRPLRALCDLASADPDSIDDLRPVAVEARRRGLITSQELSAMKRRMDLERGLRDLLS